MKLHDEHFVSHHILCIWISFACFSTVSKTLQKWKLAGLERVCTDNNKLQYIQALKYKITNKLLIFTGETRIGNISIYIIHYMIYNDLK